MQDDAGLVEVIAKAIGVANGAGYATPQTEYYARAVVAAIEAAEWVIVPKPVEFTADQLNAIVRTAIEHVGENVVANPAFRAAPKQG